MAKNFNTSMVIKSQVEPGSLQETALQQQKVFINYVAGEAMRFDLPAIRLGLNGILSIMRKLEMLPERSKKSEKTDPVLINNLKWITASASGTYHTRIKIGQTVQEGDLLAVIKDPFGSNSAVELRSPSTGMIVAKNNTPLIHEGDNLFQVAMCAKSKLDTATTLQEISQDHLEFSE
jgi:hypothetical protein